MAGQRGDREFIGLTAQVRSAVRGLPIEAKSRGGVSVADYYRVAFPHHEMPQSLESVGDEFMSYLGRLDPPEGAFLDDYVASLSPSSRNRHMAAWEGLQETRGRLSSLAREADLRGDLSTKSALQARAAALRDFQNNLQGREVKQVLRRAIDGDVRSVLRGMSREELAGLGVRPGSEWTPGLSSGRFIAEQGEGVVEGNLRNLASRGVLEATEEAVEGAARGGVVRTVGRGATKLLPFVGPIGFAANVLDVAWPSPLGASTIPAGEPGSREYDERMRRRAELLEAAELDTGALSLPGARRAELRYGPRPTSEEETLEGGMPFTGSYHRLGPIPTE